MADKTSGTASPLDTASIDKPAAKQLGSRPGRAAVRLDLIPAIRYAERRDLEWVQLTVDAVTIATEQVQDKRLEQLEEPNIHLSDVVIPALITFVLEGPLVGQLVVAAAKRLMQGPSERAAAAFARNYMGRPDAKVAVIGDVVYDLTKRADVARLLQETGGVGQMLGWVPSEHTQEHLVAAMKMVREMSGKQLSTSVAPAGDTIGSALLFAASEWARGQRIFIAAITRDAEQRAIMGTLDDRSAALYAGGRAPGTEAKIEMPPSGLMRSHSLVYEAAIWGLMFRPRVDQMPANILKGGHRPILVGGDQGLFFKGDEIRSDLVDYWLKRFPVPSSSEPVKTFADLRAAPDSRTHRDPYADEKEQLQALAQHMNAAGSKIARGDIRVLTNGSKAPSKGTKP